MFRANPIWFYEVVTSVGFFLTGCGRVNDAVQNDFKVVASFRPGGFTDSRRLWETTITPDGRAVQEILEYREDPIRITRTLSTTDLKSLDVSVTKADFFTIRHRIAASITDAASLNIAVTHKGRTHSVSVSRFSEIENDPEVRRFLLVWFAILKVVPSPDGIK